MSFILLLSFSIRSEDEDSMRSEVVFDRWDGVICKKITCSCAAAIAIKKYNLHNQVAIPADYRKFLEIHSRLDMEWNMIWKMRLSNL